MSIFRIIISLCLACILVLSCATKAIAFGGFDVGAADAKLLDDAEIYPPHPSGTPVLTFSYSAGTLNIKTSLRGGDFSEKSIESIHALWQLPPVNPLLGGVPEGWGG